jgi:hypothetical protein
MAPAASEPFALPSKNGAGRPFAESPQVPGTSLAPGSSFFAVSGTLLVATAVVMGRAAHFRTRDVKRWPFLAREAGEAEDRMELDRVRSHTGLSVLEVDETGTTGDDIETPMLPPRHGKRFWGLAQD